MLFRKVSRTGSEFCILKDLEKLQVCGLAKNDKETVKDVLANIDLNNEEILRLEKELEEHNTSEESLEVKEEVFDIDEEDDDNEKNIPSDFVSTHCGDVFNREVLLVKHQVEVHKNSLKIFDICGKSCDNQRALKHHKKIHKKLECDICLKLVPLFELPSLKCFNP